MALSYVKNACAAHFGPVNVIPKRSYGQQEFALDRIAEVGQNDRTIWNVGTRDPGYLMRITARTKAGTLGFFAHGNAELKPRASDPRP